MEDDGDYTFYSDFNCPYCYSLNERLLALGDKGSTTWRGIQHMPAADAANHGLEVQMFLSNEVGVIRRRAPEVPIATPSFLPSTGPPNRLVAALSASVPAGQLWALRTAIYRAYWREGLDISDVDILERLCLKNSISPPIIDDAAAARLDEVLAEWQREWEGECFRKRLPALLSRRGAKPLLGFPTLDLLYAFFLDTSVPRQPETMAACELKPRQQILVVGADRCRVDTRELEAPYVVRRVEGFDALRAALADAYDPDLVVLDVATLGTDSTAAVAHLRRDPAYRTLPLVALLPGLDPELELRCFDSGVTDVVFDLSNPKVTQARLELHLRLRRSTSVLQNMACYDYLTELANRREFDRRLEAEWARCRRTQRPLALCLLDIDFFKKYNDTYGHDAGDDCLRQVAAAVRSVARRPSDLVARYGGEEFVVLLAETDMDAACARAEVIVAAVRALELPHAASSAAPLVTVSVGVSAVVPTDRHLPTQLVHEADTALYQAKGGGRNRWVRGLSPRGVEAGPPSVALAGPGAPTGRTG